MHVIYYPESAAIRFGLVFQFFIYFFLQDFSRTICVGIVATNDQLANKQLAFRVPKARWKGWVAGHKKLNNKKRVLDNAMLRVKTERSSHNQLAIQGEEKWGEALRMCFNYMHIFAQHYVMRQLQQ